MKARTIILAAASAILVASVASLALLGPSSQAAGSTISFFTSRDGNFELYRFDPATSRLTRLTKLSTTERDPVVSPDGRRLAFASKAAGDLNIHVMSNIPGARAVRVTRSTAADIDPAWSPNASQIAFTSNRKLRNQIFVYDLATRRVRQLTTSGTNEHPAWSARTNQIAFTSNRDRGDRNIWMMRPDGSGQTRLTTARGTDQQPAWSPDGRRIAFSTTRDGNAEIYVLTVATRLVVRITRHKATDTHPVWSPDGRRIAFQSNRSGNLDVWVMDANGANPRQITRSRSADLSPAWGVSPTPPPTPTPTPLPPTPTPVPPTPTPVPPTPTNTPVPPTPTSTPVPQGGSPTDAFERTYGFTVEILPGPVGAPWGELSGGGFVAERAESGSGSDAFTNVVVSAIVAQELLLTGTLNAGSGPTQAISTDDFDTDLSPNVVRVEISPLVIPALDATSGSSPFLWRTFVAGQPEDVTLRFSLVRQPNDTVVRTWWDDTASGAEPRKDIVVNARRQQADSPAWSVNLIGCVLVAYSPWGNGLNVGGAAVLVETATALCDRVEVDTERSDIRQALSDLLQGSGTLGVRDITITTLAQDGTDIATTTYRDAFITRYEFPVFDKNESDVLALETVAFQANEIVLPSP